MLNPRFICMLLFALPSAAEMIPGDWHLCLQPVGQHERNTFPFQTENFPEHLEVKAHTLRLCEREKRGESQSAHHPPGKGAVTKPQLRSPVYVAEKVRAGAVWLAGRGVSPRAGAVRSDVVFYE